MVVVACTYDASTREVEAESSGVQGQSRLYETKIELVTETKRDNYSKSFPTVEAKRELHGVLVGCF